MSVSIERSIRDLKLIKKFFSAVNESTGQKKKKKKKKKDKLSFRRRNFSKPHPKRLSLSLSTCESETTEDVTTDPTGSKYPLVEWIQQLQQSK